MGRTRFDMGEMKAERFKTNDRSKLAQAYEITFGYRPEPHETNEAIRAKLIEAYPVEKVEEPTNVVPIVKDTAKEPVALRRLPNLTGNGKWEGRMRRVRYVKSDPNSQEEVITARWEQVQQDLINGQDTDLIWPLYQAAIAAVDITLEKRFTFKEAPGTKMDGALECEEKYVTKPRYTIIDLGDVPGTENLPKDYYDYFCKTARETNTFKGVARALLLKVYNILYEPKPISEWVGVSDQDIRVKIAERLGPEFEAMLSEELFGT